MSNKNNKTPLMGKYKGNLATHYQRPNMIVHKAAKQQQGYLGEPLVISGNLITPVQVSHMNTSNVSYTRSAPKVRSTAPIADFIHEDIIQRANDFAQRFLCKEDTYIRTESQMYRLFYDHTRTYTDLTLKVIEQSKDALNPKRSGNPSFEITGIQTPLENVKNLIAVGKDINSKQNTIKSLQTRRDALQQIANISTNGVNEATIITTMANRLKVSNPHALPVLIPPPPVAPLTPQQRAGMPPAARLRADLQKAAINRQIQNARNARNARTAARNKMVSELKAKLGTDATLNRVLETLRSVDVTTNVSNHAGAKQLVEYAKRSFSNANSQLQELTTEVNALANKKKNIKKNLKKLDPSVLRRAGRSNNGNAMNENALMRPIYESTRRLTGRVAYAKGKRMVLSVRDRRLNDLFQNPPLRPYVDFIHQDPNNLCKFEKPLHSGNNSGLNAVAGPVNFKAATNRFGANLNKALNSQSFQLVFNSTPVVQKYSSIGRAKIEDQIFPAQTLVCQDTRVDSTDRSVYKRWKDDSPLGLEQGSMKGVGVSMSKGVLPFRGIYGDRLMKRWIVAHSFMDTLSAALYSEFDTSNNSNDHPLFKRFEGVYYKEALNSNNNNNNNSNRSTSRGNNSSNKAKKATNNKEQQSAMLKREKQLRAKLSVERHGENASFLQVPTRAQKAHLNGVLQGQGGASAFTADQIKKILNAYWAVAGKVNPVRFIDAGNTPNIYLRPSVLNNEILNKLAPAAAAIGGGVVELLGLNQDKAQKYRGEMLSAYKNINKSSKKSSKFSKFKMADTDGISLQWKEDLRSFGSNGSQPYWIQMMREMYDVVRIRNVRLTTEQLKSGSNNDNNNNNNNNKNKKKKPKENLSKGRLSQKDVSSLFSNIKLGDNLGVTEYGYQCRDPLNPVGESWIPSYHRFGRAWYCSDVTPDNYQLPFGVYKDICAPPRGPIGSNNNNDNNGSKGSRTPRSSKITGALQDIVLNQIMTNVLQQDSRFGTQGRYGHVRTHVSDKSFGAIPPREAFKIARNLRSYSVAERAQAIDNPLVIDIKWYEFIIKNSNNRDPSFSRFNMYYGPGLQWSVLNARNALKGTGSSKFVTPQHKFSRDPSNIIKKNTAWNKIGETKESASEQWEAAERSALEATLGDDLNTLTSNLHNIRNVLETPGRNQMNQKAKNKTPKFQNMNMIETISIGQASDSAIGQTAPLRRQALVDLLGPNSNNIDWGSNKLGKRALTKYNLATKHLSSRGGGLTNKSRNSVADSQILNENVLFCDGDIYNVCDNKLNSYLFAGNNTVLGINKRYSEEGAIKLPVLPLILPLRPSTDSFRIAKRNASTYFDLMYNDASSGLRGLVDRMVKYIFVPILSSGEITKGMHYNDLMTRFMQMTAGEVNPQEIERLFKNPVAFNIMKCLTFYLYIHAGLSTSQALEQMAKIEAARIARNTQVNMYILAMHLRTLGDSGPMPYPLFQKIIKQYLKLDLKPTYMNMNSVEAEVNKLKRELSHFKLFGREFARRSFLPSFMGGFQKPNAKMGIPNTSAFKKNSTFKRVKKFVTGTSNADVRTRNTQRNRAAVGRKSNRLKQTNNQQLLGMSRKTARAERVRRTAKKVGTAAGVAGIVAGATAGAVARPDLAASLATIGVAGRDLASGRRSVLRAAATGGVQGVANAPRRIARAL
jgi:hypothetical protein